MEDKVLYKKRIVLVIDYISQILVYGSNTSGNIKFNKNTLENNNMILTVDVLKNNYFRYHNIGISYDKRMEFYKMLNDEITKKFKVFDVNKFDNKFLISSNVNHNSIEITFEMEKSDLEEWNKIIKGV